MMRRLGGRILVAIVALWSGQVYGAPPAGSGASGAIDTMAYATEMFGQLAKEHQGNLIFSPTSIEMALGMTYAGAKGDTAEQIGKALHLRGTAKEFHAALSQLRNNLKPTPARKKVSEDQVLLPQDQTPTGEEYCLEITNALWLQQSFKLQKNFSKRVEENYKAQVNLVDFSEEKEARTTINNWITFQTYDRIKEMIAPGSITPQTKLLLTNVVYFSSHWGEQFSAANTKNGSFKIAPDKTVEVPMMHRIDQYHYWENEELQLLELPFTGDSASMLIVLPKKGDGLAEMEKKIKAEQLRQWFKKLDINRVEIALPKFKFKSNHQLKNSLKVLGITDAFDSNKADFSALTKQEKVYLADALQQAFIEVDEEGCRAGATTVNYAVALSMSIDPPKPKQFVADHPFLFLIRHNETGEILFMGRLTNPKGE